jgi:hypothetical protein
MDDPPRALRPVLAHQGLERDPLEILHCIIKNAVGGPTVIVNGNGVGVGEAARELHLALEPRDALLAGLVGGQQLDRRGAAEHGVAGLVDDAHAALSDLLLERVLPELLRLAHLLLEAVDHPGRHRGDHHGRQAPHDDADGEERGVVPFVRLGL